MVYKPKRGDAQEPHADGISGCLYEFNCKTYIVECKSIIVIFFSYMALLMIVESNLFLDEYPRWDLGSPHLLVILYEMFLHAESRGRKEAECMYC